MRRIRRARARTFGPISFERLEDRSLLAATAVGADLLVNSFSGGYQSTSAAGTAIALSPGGDGVVVFEGRGAGDRDGIFAHRISAAGAPISARFPHQPDRTRVSRRRERCHPRRRQLRCRLGGSRSGRPRRRVHAIIRRQWHSDHRRNPGQSNHRRQTRQTGRCDRAGWHNCRRLGRKRCGRLRGYIHAAILDKRRPAWQ